MKANEDEMRMRIKKKSKSELEKNEVLSPLQCPAEHTTIIQYNLNNSIQLHPFPKMSKISFFVLTLNVLYLLL